VLVLTLLSALNPVRLALTLLMISRPRPVQNLLAFWAGCLTGAISTVVVPLTLLHVTRMSDSVGQGGAASATIRHVQIAMGVLALSIAALMTVRSLRRRGQRSQLPTQEATRGRRPTDGTASTLVLDSTTPTTVSRLLSRTQDAPTEGGSVFRRLLRRAQNAWENGSLWVAYLIGNLFGGPQPDVALFVVAIIGTAGAAIGAQIIAAIAFVVGTFAVVEIILVSYLVTPAKTHAVLRLVHDWSSSHRRQILVALFAVAGIALVTQGVGGV
jgi:Sap, sulfolipid-1-addressing protein